MPHLAQSLESRGIKGHFKFTDTTSFRLFVEGVKGLRTYERSAAPEALRTAETKFAQCVVEYPRDVLPQFYLGIVNVFRGYDGADAAVRVFESIARDVPQLRAAAIYNLASAYIELYTPESLDLARKRLMECVEELQGDESVEGTTLRFQARALLLFYEIRQRLWVKRRDPPETLKAEIDEAVPELHEGLKKFLGDLEGAKKIPEDARADIMADYWNDRGILEEFRAWTAPDEKKKQELARTAVESYTKSLQMKLNWIPAKSNMARVYMDLLGDFDSAIKCWQEVLQVRPGDNYAEYMLGRLFDKRGDLATAISHYEKAPHILEASKKRARLYETLGRESEASEAWRSILLNYPTDKEALEAQVRLRFLGPTPASGAPPKA